MTDLASRTAEPDPISDETAKQALSTLNIQADPAMLHAYKTLGTWLVQNDVGATKLAQTFDSDAQIDFAIKISRELTDNPDPYIRVNGVKSLLLAVKTRSAVAKQAIELAHASASKGAYRGRNFPPTMTVPVQVNINNVEKPAIPI